MKNLFITAILFITVSGFSQNHELGKVTIDELKQKVCPSDTSASATILFNIGKTTFEYSESDGFELVTIINTKIKIYKKEGYDLGNQTVRFYTGNNINSEKVDFTKAATYNLVNDKIEKTKLSSEGEFVEKINKFWSRKKITMPNVKEGSIIEFKTEIRSPYIDIPDWEFQKSIPVVYSEFTTFVPEYFIFNTRSKGYQAPVKSQEKLSKSFAFATRPTSVASGRTTTGMESGSNKIDYFETKTKYVLENVPSLKEEAYVNNIDNYRTTLLHELSGKRFPNSPYENFSTDWMTVTKRIYENENFGSELQKSGYFEKDLEALLAGKTAQDEKTAIIFNYVKSRMNWNETYSVYCDDGVRKAYQDKKGNAAEINLMLTAMLRYAGVDANPVLISTRSNGISFFPSRTSFNYIICGIELQNQTVLLDATSKYSLPNILPIRDLNWFGRLIKKDGTSAEIDLMPKTNSKDVVNIMATINEQGEVSGKIRDQYFDYNAFVYRERNNVLSKESYIEKIEKSHQGLEIGEFEVLNKNDLSLPIVENYTFTSTNSVEVIGDKMYIAPFLFFTTSENPFKQESREYPIDFIFPDQEKYTISLTIPAGYAVDVLPTPKAVALPDNMTNFKYNISTLNNQIQIIYTFDKNRAIIGAEYYQGLKEFYKEIVNKQTEKIVLKKV